jgi:tRNA A37 methylthiotransferase MiaB
MNYSVKESRELMDYLVNQALMEWQIYNINPSTENYMADKEIEAAIQYIIKKVMVEMTDISRLRLSIGYPMETEDEQIESIKNRAKLAVLNYAVNQNSDNEEDRIPIQNINAF